MKILYLGTKEGTSGYRANALRRLQHEVEIVDPLDTLPRGRLIGAWERYLGSVGLASLVRTRLLKILAGRGAFDVVWVDAGALVSRELVEDLKRVGQRVLNYNHDDPYGSRDLNYWQQYRAAVSAYDLLVVVRKENMQEARSLGARKVLLVYRSADEVAHAGFQLSEEDRARWASEVLFVGTAFPERGPFFANLINRGVPVSIFGDRWEKLREWTTIRPFWRGSSLNEIRPYASAISSAKVCLGLLSKGNRDLHTTRSMEIPSLGGVLCAERTEEHVLLYEEDREAVFWNDAEECAAKCHALLADEMWRRSLAENGHRRYLENGWTNMKVAETILKCAFE